eukprot:8986917-Karenia_brevis.AAC.1
MGSSRSFPSVEVLDSLIDSARGQCKQELDRVKSERVSAWRSWLREAMKFKPKQVMRWCKDTSAGPVSLLARAD